MQGQVSHLFLCYLVPVLQLDERLYFLAAGIFLRIQTVNDLLEFQVIQIHMLPCKYPLGQKAQMSDEPLIAEGLLIQLYTKYSLTTSNTCCIRLVILIVSPIGASYSALTM